jgi:hypothetical protein
VARRVVTHALGEFFSLPSPGDRSLIKLVVDNEGTHR